jgi:superfamily II DNA or RNA helicase
MSRICVPLTPYYFQEEAIVSIFQYFYTHPIGNPVVALPTGCHAKGTGILMFDGTVRTVEHIQVGDLLMGPNSQPRKILRLARGQETMVKVTPNKGESFIVNANHILSLKTTQEKAVQLYPCQLIKGRCENITVIEYQQKSPWFKHTRKLWRTGVTFQPRDPLPLDPYFLGLFLGDGSYCYSTVMLTTMDKVLANYWCQTVQSFGDFIRISSNGSKALTYNATTKIKNRTRRTVTANKLDRLGLRECRVKFIPQEYKVASIEDRLQLLAGLIDTDGFLSYGGYEITTVFERLRDDLLFLARSLGFAAYYTMHQSGAFRCFISGDCNRIPVKLDRRKALARAQKKNHLVTGFKIEKLPPSNFYGFELDGDHLYLTADFTVHHNTGKSVVIAEFIRRALKWYPQTRVMVATHVKELIDQNHKELMLQWPSAPAGVYSAGLKRRDTHLPITFCGIQSVAKCLDYFGHIDLLLIDECHMISDKGESMYVKAIEALKTVNPKLKVIGFTATPFRLGMGMLTEGKLFTDVCVDYCNLEKFNELVDGGFICPLIPKHTELELNVDDVHIHAGEYVIDELQKAVDKESITRAALEEAVRSSKGRRHYLVFCTGTSHADHARDILCQLGIPAVCVHSALPGGDQERDRNILLFKAGMVGAMVGVGVFTTGFNFKGIDCIIVLRPTMSTVLWVQLLGRGTRPFPEYSKENCLVLDFAANTRRLGPINDPVIPRRKGKKGTSFVPFKTCPTCSTYNHARVRFCIECGYEFPQQFAADTKPAEEELIRKEPKPPKEENKVETYTVEKVEFSKHWSRDSTKPPSLKVSYYCGYRVFNEWLCLEHANGFARHRANDSWRLMAKGTEDGNYDPPETIDEALSRVDHLAPPTEIRVLVKSKYPEIVGYEFKTAPAPLVLPIRERTLYGQHQHLNPVPDDDVPF